MDRKWNYLLAFFYVLLSLPVVISAAPGEKLSVLLDFSTLYVLSLMLAVGWWYGERITSLLRRSEKTLEERADTGRAIAATDRATEETPVETRPPVETPRLVRMALEAAAGKLATLGDESPNGEAAPPKNSNGVQSSPAVSDQQSAPNSPPATATESPASSASPASVIDGLVSRAVTAIETPESADPCLKRLSGGNVRVLVSVLIPGDGPRQTVTNRRKQFRQRLDARLVPIGWRQVRGSAVYTYERD